jgi:hypothetical protein
MSVSPLFNRESPPGVTLRQNTRQGRARRRRFRSPRSGANREGSPEENALQSERESALEPAERHQSNRPFRW